MTTSPTQRPVDTPTVDPPTPVSGWKTALKRDAIRVPLLAWFVAHSIVVLVAVIAYAAFGFTGPPVDPSVTGPFTLLGTWDTTWYLGIARDGYTDQLTTLGQDEQYSNLAFFPLIPGLLWVFDAIGINPFFALLVVSHLAALVALVGFRALAADRMSAAQANLATWCFALFPSTLAASMAYTEAITLALTITAAWFATRGRWVPAALFAGVVTLARPTGFLAALLGGADRLALPRQTNPAARLLHRPPGPSGHERLFAVHDVGTRVCHRPSPSTRCLGTWSPHHRDVYRRKGQHPGTVGTDRRLGSRRALGGPGPGRARRGLIRRPDATASPS